MAGITGAERSRREAAATVIRAPRAENGALAELCLRIIFVRSPGGGKQWRGREFVAASALTGLGLPTAYRSDVGGSTV